VDIGIGVLLEQVDVPFHGIVKLDFWHVAVARESVRLAAIVGYRDRKIVGVTKQSVDRCV